MSASPLAAVEAEQVTAMETAQNYARLREAIEKHGAQLKNAARVYAKKLGKGGPQNEELPKDIMQEAMARAWETADRYDEWPLALLRKYVFNAARTLIKKKRRSRLRLVADMSTDRQGDGERLTEDELLDRLWYIQRDQSEWPDLDPLISQLSPADQRVLHLFLKGYLGADLALQLSKDEGKPVRPGTADVRLHRAKARLLAAYQQHQRIDR